MDRATRYQVRVRVEGELAPGWSAVLGGLAVAPQADGTTVLVGELADQAAVHGALVAVRDLGLPLVSIETSAHPSAASQGDS
jgi:hypothetical protein